MPTFSGGKPDLRQTGAKPQSKTNTLRVFMIDTSKVYDSKYGKFIITNYKNSHNVEIKFSSTGFVTTTQVGNIRRGCVKDKLYPNVYGVGFVGDGDFSSKSNKKAYKSWCCMLARCYSDDLHQKYPTYKDCTVCDSWLCFQVFAKWYYKNYPLGGINYQLDKDIRVKGNKVYSPETCLFVTQKENKIESKAKRYKIKSPLGLVIDVYNMREFCKNNLLNPSHMCAVNNGKLQHHKGWTKG